MDHEQALTNRAAERYALGQMTQMEAEAFEQHFFECEICARELEEANSFLDMTRESLGEPARVEAEEAPVPVVEPRRGGWLERLRVLWAEPAFLAACAAACGFAAITLYQAGLVMPRLRSEASAALEPRALSGFVLKAATRGEENVVQLAGDAAYFTLNFDVPGNSSARYQCEIQSSEGAHWQVEAARPPEGVPLSLLMPAGRFHEGRYEVTIRGAGETPATTELARFSFVLKKGG